MIKPDYKLVKKITMLIVKYVCVKEMKKVNKNYINIALKNTNGCGPDGFGLLVPDFNLTEVCNWHDVFYNVKAYGLAKFALKGNRLARFYSFFTSLFGKDRGNLNIMDYNMFNDMLRLVIMSVIYEDRYRDLVFDISKILTMSISDMREKILPYDNSLFVNKE